METLTHHMIDDQTTVLDEMVVTLFANGYKGGKYMNYTGEFVGVYADTAWFDEADKLKELFPNCRVTRLPNSLITVIKPTL